MCITSLLAPESLIDLDCTRLYGITVYQAYKYYTVYTDDRIRLKLYVRSASLGTVDEVTDGGLQITVVLFVYCSAFVYRESLTRCVGC